MKLIAESNKHCYTVNHIIFDDDGTIRYVRGFMSYAGNDKYDIGIHADYKNLDENLTLSAVPSEPKPTDKIRFHTQDELRGLREPE